MTGSTWQDDGVTTPLEGIRVLDLTRVLSGPHCTRMLADLGADVIKVEPPDGDLTRFASPRINGLASYFVQQNAGKRNISLDLSKPGATEIVLDLAEHCDVLVENFRPGVMARNGLGYDVVAARNPRIVYASITGYGATGPWVDRRAYAPGGRRRDRDDEVAGRRARRLVRQRPAQPRRRLHGARDVQPRSSPRSSSASVRVAASGSTSRWRRRCCTSTSTCTTTCGTARSTTSVDPQLRSRRLHRGDRRVG